MNPNDPPRPPQPPREGDPLTDAITADVKPDASHQEPAHIRTIASELNGHLGGTLVAALSGTRNSKEPYAWAAGHTQPDAAQDRRLRVAHLVWRQVADAESDDVARAWFCGANPFLDEHSAVTALRQDRLDEVRSAAKAFITGTWAG